MANKGSLIVIASLIFLAASVLFSYSSKKEYLKESKRAKQEIAELKETKDLQKLWRAKGMKSKLNKALASFGSKNLKIERKKATLTASNLSYTQLNKMLNKLASLPLRFEELKVDKRGDNFDLECKCVW